MLLEIIHRSKTGTLSNNFQLNPSLGGGVTSGGSVGGSVGVGSGGVGGVGGVSGVGGGIGDNGTEKTIEMQIPPDKCGLIIGKGGETIKMLQQSLGVKMLLIQDSTENIGAPKPLRISGSHGSVDNAVNAVQQMMAQRDAQIAQQKMDRGDNGSGNGVDAMFSDELSRSVVGVPKAAVGVVIGKGGDMINQIQNLTGTRIQFKPEDPLSPERMCSIMGPKDGVDQAVRRIHEIIHNVQERDGIVGGRGGGSGGGGATHGGGGTLGNFGLWEAPMGHRGGLGGQIGSEEHLVPANKTGLVIGKGGETIKQINHQSGAHAEIQKNPPPGSDPSYKTFIIKGTNEQIKLCRQLIQEKVDAGPGGIVPSLQNSNIRAPPPNAYAPPPQGYASVATPQYGTQAQIAPPQAQQAQVQSFPQTQPWQSQYAQWNPPTAAATPQQNAPEMAKPATDMAHNANYYTYLQLQQAAAQQQVAQQQAVYQQSAANANASAGGVAPAQDFSKEWSEYLKNAQTNAVTSATAVVDRGLAITPAASAPSAGLQNPGAATGAATAAPAAAQDYTAQWAEYYRQCYALQGQQFALTAGQPPGQT